MSRLGFSVTGAEVEEEEEEAEVDEDDSEEGGEDEEDAVDGLSVEVVVVLGPLDMATFGGGDRGDTAAAEEEKDEEVTGLLSLAAGVKAEEEADGDFTSPCLTPAEPSGLAVEAHRLADDIVSRRERAVFSSIVSLLLVHF